MPRTIVIDPVTRIEGHAKVTIHLDDAGRVTEARFHATEFRGFEKFCVGRHITEMPVITSRICGICPVSHMLTAADAGDRVAGVAAPPAAIRLRRLVNLAQIVQSHALSFFHLASPDLVLGFNADPARRNIAGLAAADPEFARGGIRLRQFGQTVIHEIAGRRVHPAWAVPGGVTAPLAAGSRDRLLALLPEALDTAVATLRRFTRDARTWQREAAAFGSFPSLFLGMVAPDGALEHYGGRLRLTDADGHIVADQLDAASGRALIAEAVEPWSYMKFPYYAPMGYPAGVYCVGALARLNVASYCGTPLADEELAAFRELGRGAVLGAFHYHHARLIEIVHCLERIRLILDDPSILDSDVLAETTGTCGEGIGVAEAPRGTLFHHYRVDEDGLVTWVDLLIATGQNNLSMNRTVLEIARQVVAGDRLSEGALNRVEAGIRAFDPCLSCATHAAGTMPLRLELLAADGTLLHEVERSR